MKSEIFFGKRGCEVEHRKFNRALLKHEFSSDPLQPDQMYNWTEACKNNAENPTSGNMSDDSSSTNFSKEAISTTSASWDDEHSCGNSYQNMPNNIKSCLPDNADFSLGDSKENLLEFDQHDALSQVEYQLAWLTIQYHALAESYSDSINRLRQAETDVNSLRKENFQLQATNMKFARLFGMRERHILDGKTHDGLLAEPSRQSLNNIELPLDAYSNSFYNDQLVMNSGANASRVLNGSLSHDPFSLLSKSNNGPPISNGLSVVSRQGQSKALKQGNKMKNITADIPENSPTSVLSFEDHRTDFNKKICSKPLPSSERNLNKSINKPLARHSAVLPKSISIRSTGFLNMKVDTNREGGLKLPLQNLQLSKPVVPILSPKRPHRLRLAATADTQAIASTPGDVENLGNVEYDVYNQGMFKTELCNKWQDTGACPYGERCQFAHGIEELRPVIRHPRYKTELCRMVAAGEKCPYGHRCHFRHSLTTEEKTDLQD